MLNKEAKKRHALEAIYNGGRGGACEIWTSMLSMIECRRFHSEQDDPKPYDEGNDRRIKEMFRQQFVRAISLTVDIAEESRRIWRTTEGLSNFRDATHVASALRWNVPTMHTYDRKDLLHLSEKFTCANGSTLKICYPEEAADGPLFAPKKG